jgi:hypothetical protein
MVRALRACLKIALTGVTGEMAEQNASSPRPFSSGGGEGEESLVGPALGIFRQALRTFVANGLVLRIVQSYDSRVPKWDRDAGGVQNIFEQQTVAVFDN